MKIFVFYFWVDAKKRITKNPRCEDSPSSFTLAFLFAKLSVDVKSQYRWQPSQSEPNDVWWFGGWNWNEIFFENTKILIPTTYSFGSRISIENFGWLRLMIWYLELSDSPKWTQNLINIQQSFKLRCLIVMVWIPCYLCHRNVWLPISFMKIFAKQSEQSL